MFLGIVGIGVFFSVSDIDLGDLGINPDDFKIENLSYYTSSEISQLPDNLIGQKVKVKGVVSYRLRNPDYIGTTYSLDDLPIKIPSDQTAKWWDRINQDTLVEGILASKPVNDPVFKDETRLYYLENPQIIQE